jgi:hypothetical protein
LEERLVVKKADDVVIIENSKSDLDEVLAEADIDRLDEANRDALRDALNAMQAHPLNAGRGKPSVLVPGVNVHFRLVPTLYSAFVATLGVIVTIGTAPINPVIAGVAGTLTGAQIIKDIGEKFSRLNAQEAAVYGALSRAIKERRQRDPKARDATAQDVEAEIRPADPGLARAAGRTLDVLAGMNVVKATPRTDDVFYSICQ